MPYFENSEKEWIHFLSDEAERDIIFLWHITGAKFGGPTYSEKELSMAIEPVTNALIVAGSTVGFGDPDKADWKEDRDLLNAKNPGAAIAARRVADSKESEFLAFARRS
ncbi:hypothetical protein [Duganella hordei]|uniref:hypothetical protein n=1 Tax=Duganella hordei TaxID=2865934 RepID=UPI0030E8A0A3